MEEVQQVILEKNVPCPMRDGTVLYADIYRPNIEGEFPVLLTRLPYNKDLPMYSHRYLDTNRLVQNGYIVIIQDVRGRFASEGEFYPFFYEAEDGYDTVEWAAQLPYASGKVGMFGLSYYGFTQLLAATERPPHLKAIVPAMTLSNWQNDAVEYQGKFLVGSSETWALESIAPDLLKRKYKDPEEYASMMMEMAEHYNNIEEWYLYKPIEKWPPLQKLGVAEFFYDFLNGQLSDKDMERMSILNKYEHVNVPAYHIAGWYDNFLQATIRNYTQLNEMADSASQKLIIGPWGHGVFSSTLGERSFGIHASGDWIDYEEDLTGLHIRWFDKFIKEKSSSNSQEAPIKLFVMGINEWRDEYEWPLARTTYTPFYFHSEGSANTGFGNGCLSVENPDMEPYDSYVYDPSNPVLTNGGGTLFAGVNTMGPRDQRDIETREDVLVYTSEPLTKPLEVTGPIKVKLWAKTDATDTDFTAKLIDVMPDGKAYNLTDGIVRAKYRDGYKQESSIKDEIIEYEIDLWATSNVFLPGHCIRVEISSSNFPRYDTNLNTGKTMVNSKEKKNARQTIFHQEEYPSHILLPVICMDPK
ncbi:putative CocE/NonD family hydrolase [Bacillus pakistanensis]|uniref:CocE/NonD family hydrolase n=1 Tax=Rossellomorea pakistanensis TaxID=992288 RepID=A0ABS2NE17_9BACI|nr:CocE/NonD family hydrolase [Bacillus pakistanensis]MBM7586100.1 putative CocE/NonD family hydrolase [Bacillus pakistanensis]